MRRRDAERAARHFVADRFPRESAEWNFDLCLEYEDAHGRKSWSFALTPDEEDEDYATHRALVGYVHADGAVEGMY